MVDCSYLALIVEGGLFGERELWGRRLSLLTASNGVNSLLLIVASVGLASAARRVDRPSRSLFAPNLVLHCPSFYLFPIIYAYKTRQPRLPSCNRPPSSTPPNASSHILSTLYQLRGLPAYSSQLWISLFLHLHYSSCEQKEHG